MFKVLWNPNDKELRKFGATLLVGFGLIGGLMFWRGHAAAARAVWGAAGAVGVLALLLPRAALLFYKVWMGIAFVMGGVVSRVVLFLIFYAVITPVALLMRLWGRDALRLKKGGGGYWAAHPAVDDPASYDHLF